jgi:hypothetical protein
MPSVMLHDRPMRSQSPLRPLDMTQIINSAVMLLLGKAAPIAAALALANLPLLLWQALAVYAPGEWAVPPRYRSAQDLYTLLRIIGRFFTPGFTPARVAANANVSLLLSLLASLMQSAVLVPLIAAWYRERPLALAAALPNALAAFPRLLLAYCVPGLALLGAGWLYARSDFAAALTIAGLALVVPFWLFISQAVLIEGAAPLHAVWRSASLVKRRYLGIFGTWLVFELVFAALTAIPTFVIGMVSVSIPPGTRLNVAVIAAGNLAIVIIEPLRDAIFTLFYYEQRRRNRDADA